MINLPTKFEVPNFIRYGNMKGVAKCRKWGGLGWLGVTESYRQCHHSIERMRLPIHQKLYVYLVPFSRYSELFVEIRQLLPTSPAFGGPRWE